MTRICSICSVLSVIFISNLESASVPRFVSEPQSVVVRTGSNVVLTCSVQPDTAALRWTLNGTAIVPQKRRGFEVRDGNLRISSFNQQAVHVGSYQCIATNSIGTVVSSEAKVEVAALGTFETPAPTVTDVKALEGNTAVIPCVAPYSRPQALVEFEFNGTKISTSTRHVILPSGSLQIANVGMNDQGSYECSAFNSVLGQRVRSNAAHQLRVLVTRTHTEPTYIASSPGSITVAQGSDLTLECVAEGWPAPNIMWEKYGGHLPAGRFSQVLGNLVLVQLQKFDSGTYLCHVNNSVGLPPAKVISVDVLEPPQIETSPTDQLSIEGSTVVFKCRAQGSPKPSVQWLYNGSPLVSGQFIAVRDSSLQLSNIHRRHSGMYQCIAKNSVGMVHASARLVVTDQQQGANANPGMLPGLLSTIRPATAVPSFYEERPGGKNKEQEEHGAKNSGVRGGSEDENLHLTPSKPEISKLTDSSVLVRWTLPLPIPGGPALAMFKIQYKDSADDQLWFTVEDDISPSLRMFEVPKLRAGKTYRFRVIALYTNFDSKQGTTSTKFTLEPGRSVLPSPIIVEARPLSVSEIFIGWQLKESDQMLIEGFYIHFFPFDDPAEIQKMAVPGSRVRHAVLSHLTPSTSYSIRVQSYGLNGVVSDNSNAVVKQTLENGNQVLRDNGDYFGSLHPPQVGNNNNGDFADGSTARSHVEEYMPGGSARGSTGNASQLMYIIVGVVLAVALLVIIVCASMCFWKQHQKQQIMASSAERKHLKDSNQTSAFLTSMTLKSDVNPTENPIKANNYNYNITTTHLPTCTGGCTLPGGVHGNGACSGGDNFDSTAQNHNGLKKHMPELTLPPPPPVVQLISANSFNHRKPAETSTNTDEHRDSGCFKPSPIYTKLSDNPETSVCRSSNPPFDVPKSSQGQGLLLRLSPDHIPRLHEHSSYLSRKLPSGVAGDSGGSSGGSSSRSHPVQMPQSGSRHVDVRFAGCEHQIVNPGFHTINNNAGRKSEADDVFHPSRGMERCVSLDSLNTMSPGTSIIRDSYNSLDSPELFIPIGASSSKQSADNFIKSEHTSARQSSIYANAEEAVDNSWKNLTNQISDGSYNLQYGRNNGPPARFNDYLSSDQESYR